MNIYKKEFEKYIKRGYNVVPDKHGGKGYALKGLSDFCYKNIAVEQASAWANDDYLEKVGSNIAVLTGKESGVIALDLDCDNEEVLKKIEHLLPDSPIEKRGSKGWTRFFRFTGESTDLLKYNGEVVIELLSTGKKTTIPPSLHPNGSDYTWTKGDLAEIDPHNLPAFPPFLIAELTRLLGGEKQEYGKVSNGRNMALSSKLGELLQNPIGADEAIQALLKFDEEENEVPYFTDPNEHRHTDAITNALMFYSTHLNSINAKRYRDSKEYLDPGLTTANIAALEELHGKKSQSKGSQRKLKAEYIHADTALGKIHETIIKNSWIPQPELALGATLALGAVLTSRKFVFQNISPNLYVCNISPSGCVDADTEFMTPYGWKRISEYIKGDKVLQYDVDTGEATFTEPLEYVRLPEKTMIKIESDRGAINQVLSNEHRMLFFNGDKVKIERAGDFYKKYYLNKKYEGTIETAFNYQGKGLDYSLNELRLSIAYFADGRNLIGSPNIYIKKERKKERLIYLLESTNTPYKRSDYTSGYSRFSFVPPILSKHIPDNFYNLSRKQMEAVLDECFKWDGHINKKGGKKYFSTIKGDCDFIQFAASSLGYRSTISKDIREGRTTCYGVLLSKQSSRVSIGPNPKISKIDAKMGLKFCFKVPTDTLVLRRNDRIFITKNSGKDSPQQFVKSLLAEVGAKKMLGAGDYVSDASLMDSLGLKPTRLDIMDEMGGILKTLNTGKSEYNGKMADILAELYTSSNSKYLGRATAEGIKGECDRPNVSILGSTTPTGFREGVSKTAIQKGLMGRFLLFFGESEQRATRINSTTDLPSKIKEHLKWLKDYNPEKQGTIIEGKPQWYTPLEAEEDANKLLDEIFEEFDDLRIKNIQGHSAPIIARLYQQMIKLVIIHALLNANKKVPKISTEDIKFGYNIIKAYYEEIEEIIGGLIFDSQIEKDRYTLVTAIKDAGGVVTKHDLFKRISQFNKTQRDKLIADCLDGGLIMIKAYKDVGNVFCLTDGGENEGVE